MTAYASTSFANLSPSKISPSIKRPTSFVTPSTLSYLTRAGTLFTFQVVLKAFFGSLHLKESSSGQPNNVFDGERRSGERAKYSGLWPTSTKAACGFFAPVKVLSRVGRAATTSGHQGFFVEGSLEARNAMKKVLLVEAGNTRSLIALGRAKFCWIGMVFDFYIFRIGGVERYN
jgi:hypothetical protein